MINGYLVLQNYPTLASEIESTRYQIMHPYNPSVGNNEGGKSNIRECEVENTVMQLLGDTYLNNLYNSKKAVEVAVSRYSGLDDICNRVERELNLR